ncbi:asparagine synthase (glutamine-hydrolyzing) [Oleispirillum naphthae]|uniref:asparagine synthase (glutamine-hydrolyzing) n=1 Tax=Oleispirillum naphthae TaxID=2838853 RepID=UPI0030824284
MCGIAGIITTPEARDILNRRDASLQAMAAAIAHRGPDGQGGLRREGAAFAHLRLAIIDLTGGDQPLYGPGNAVLVGNGEIYNYRELRAEFPDTTFATNSDCEPPLFLYRRDGLDFVNHLRGMYALALHDPRGERVVLTRDPFGIKPLYYMPTRVGIAFASEPQALIAADWAERAVNPAKAVELLQLQFTTGKDTIFPDIKRLAPGETLLIENGQIAERRYRSCWPAPDPEAASWQTSGEAAVARFDAVFENSVDFHQRADVPYGMFLSGGVDSAAVLAMMARLNPQPVVAFTAGFPETGVHDEREHARAVAHAARAEHIEVPVLEYDFWSHLPKIVAAMDDPVADYAIVPTWFLAREAAKSVKVILSGEGGDELFAGYGRYRAAVRPWPFRKAMRAKGVLDGLGVLRDGGAAWRQGIAAAEKAVREAGIKGLQAQQALDCLDWLPNDLLTKLDRCLMAHGVEGRVPFLDVEVARFAQSLPESMRVHGKLGKYVVRRWLEKHLPQSKPFSKKRGFTVPVAEWIALEAKHLGPLVAAQAGVAEICDPEAVRRVFASLSGGKPDKRAGFAAWNLLFYALWHRRHIENAAAEGGVFDVLAAR